MFDKIELTVFDWHTENGVSVCGNMFYNGKHVSNSVACNLFNNVQGVDEVIQLLADISGFFGVVAEQDQQIFLAGDVISSYPLYYSAGNEKFVSDKYYWVENQIPGETIPLHSLVEFVQSLYVPQGDTLHPEIKRIRPGQVVSIPRDGNEAVKTGFYFELNTTLEAPDENYMTNMECVLDKSFQRLKKIAGEKPIILFLSGGYDSRLVAYMLKRHAFENVYTLCHAVDPLKDYPESKYVANQLGFEWVGYKRTDDKLRRWYKSDDWWNVEEMIGGWGTTNPTNNLGFVLKQMSTDGRLPDSGIIVSGHSIASIGSYIPHWGSQLGQVESTDVVNSISEQIYTTGRKLNEDTKPLINEILTSKISNDGSIGVKCANNIIESWHQDRSEKRYRNHRYMYDYWGFERWAPLWSREFQEFYSSLPVRHRKDRQLYENYIKKLDDRFLDDPSRVQSHEVESKVESIASILSGTSLYRPGKLAYDKMKSISDRISTTDTRKIYDSEPQFRIIDYDQFEKLYTGSEHRKILLVVDALGRTSLEVPKQHPYEYTFTELSCATDND